jgi:hypothetical protein
MTLLPGAPRTFDTRISPFPGTFQPVGHVMCTAKSSARFAYRSLEPAPTPAPACLRSPRFRLALLSSLLSASVVPPFLKLPNPHPTCWDVSWLCRAFHSTSCFSPRYSGRFQPTYALPSRSHSRYLVPVGVGGALRMSYGVRYHIPRARTLDLPLHLASPSRPAPTRARPRPTLDMRLVMAPLCPCIELVTPVDCHHARLQVYGDIVLGRCSTCHVLEVHLGLCTDAGRQRVRQSSVIDSLLPHPFPTSQTCTSTTIRFRHASAAHLRWSWASQVQVL